MGGVVRFLCIFLFVLLHLPHVYWSFDHWHTLYLYLGLYMLMYVIHLYLQVLFLFFLYAHASYILYAIFYFRFTIRCRDEFCLKCFKNTDCQSLLAINLFLQIFLRIYVKIDFIVFKKWIWVESFMTSLICSLVCCGFVTNCQRERLLGHMWFNDRNIC